MVEGPVGIGRGCVSEDGRCALVLSYRSCCQRQLAIVVLWASIGGLDTAGKCPKRDRSWVVVIGKEW